jgi:hypothetical protein
LKIQENIRKHQLQLQTLQQEIATQVSELEHLRVSTVAFIQILIA